jgi:mono/diheme cytochrome c family protein
MIMTRQTFASAVEPAVALARAARPRLLTALLLCAPLGFVAVTASCTHLPNGTPDMTSNPPDLAVNAPDMAGMTAAQRGQQLVTMYHCGNCHTSSDPKDGILSGQTTPRMGTMAYGANLTPDSDTGIGDWSDDQIKRAITTGIDDSGDPLCPPMPRFSTLTADNLNDIVAYLRSIPAVKHDIPESSCPPIKPKPMDGGASMDGGTPIDGGNTDAH